MININKEDPNPFTMRLISSINFIDALDSVDDLDKKIAKRIKSITYLC